MREARLKFEREGLEGLIPVDSYLSDAAGRFGIRFEEKCMPAEGLHYCRIVVAEGNGHLTALTDAEDKGLTEDERAAGTRLACQVKVSEPEEIVIMTAEKETPAAEEKTEASPAEEYSKKFAEMPLEKKIAELVRLEAITLGDTFSFILNSPYLIFDKAIDVLAEFGLKKENRDKRESRPAEHRDASAEEDSANGRSAAGSVGRKKKKEQETRKDI